ncbi:uncharacterized protein METZ01_LOCUS509350, partial [marine metagenome]
PISDPGFHDVFAVIEDCSKPVIAAIHGTALGAGLEAALACHYRCAEKGARMGLPEVSLGIIPGAGGSQRLPRLVSAKESLEFILGISPIDADKALKLGIIDHIIDGDFKEGVRDYVRSLLSDKAGPRRTSEMQVNSTGYDDEFLAAARKLANRRARGQRAPELVIEAINNAINLPFDEGIREEKRIGDEALISDESKALRYIFFAEREIGKVPQVTGDINKIPIENVAVLG